MSSWKIQLQSGQANAIVELIDTFGPVNRYQFTDKSSFIPDTGDFTNQTNNVVPEDINSWVLYSINIDILHIGQIGRGECFDGGGNFPSGPFTWTVIEKL